MVLGTLNDMANSLLFCWAVVSPAVNAPSAPTPDLGVGGASDWNGDNDYG